MAVKCFYHKRRDAVGACVHCGKLVCSDCEVTLKKKIYCNPCVEELFGEQPAAVEAEPGAEVTKPAARAPKKPVAVAAAKAEAAEAAAPQVARAKKRTGMWVGLGVGLAFVFIVVPLLLLIIALGGQPEPPTGEWKANPTIKEPLTANIAGQDVVLGDLNKQQVEVKLPGSAFQQAAQVTVRNAKNAPPVPPDEFTPLGAPIEIDTGELPSRLYELATITFKLDRKAMESEPDPGAYWVAHYTGGEWEYVEPDEVNPEEGTISIRTDNFLIFGWGTISVKEYIEEYAKSKAVAKWAQKNVDDKSKKALEMCLSPALKKLGVTDDLTKKLVTSIFTDPECDNLRKGIEEGDMDTITESLGNLLGKNFHTILESRGDDELWLGKTQIKSPLGATIQYAGEVKAIATAAGQAAEGKYQAAAGTLVKDVFSKWVLGSSVPVQVILDLKGAGEELARFLDNRMFEQAYQIYTTGSTYGMGRTQQWAYSDVEKGNFQQVWDQSHYVRRQLIDKFMAMEQDKPANKRLSRREAEDRARNYLEALFNNRQESEVEIAQEEARIKKLINLFKAEALSDPAMRDFMYPWQKGWFSDYRPDRPPKESLDELLRVMGIIKRETGLEPEELVEADLVQLASELIEIRQKIRAGQQEDPFYRSQAYQDTLKKYAAFTITAPQDILEGKGVPGTSYTFTAQIRELPGIFLYYDWYVNGVVEKKDSASRTFPRAFKTPGPYTVKCVAHWREGPKGAQDVVRKEKLAELKFNIAELAELKISVSPAMPSSKGTADINYTFRAQATGAPEGASYQWYKDGQLIAGSEASKTITFTEGTHTVAVK
ncbi:MAG: hypothetical protein FJZ85_09540, partial [Chloroflexi bacterium]|nr:hypothetical protein [Chloroflexota bacterium]